MLTSGVGLLITGVATLDFFPVVSSLFIIPHGIIGVSLSLPRGAPLSETFEKQRELRRAKLDRRLNHYLGKEVYYLRDGDDGELPAVVYGTVKGAVSDDKLLIKIGELDDRASAEITPTLEAYEEVEIARIGSILVPDHEDVGRYVQLISDADNPEYPYIIARINKVYIDGHFEIVTEKVIDSNGETLPIDQHTVFIHKAMLLERLSFDPLLAAASPDVAMDFPTPSGLPTTRNGVIGKLVDRHIPDIALKSLSMSTWTLGIAMLTTGLLTENAVILLASWPASVLGVMSVIPSFRSLGGFLPKLFDRYRERQQTKLAKHNYLEQEVYYLHDNGGGKPPSVVYGTIKGTLPDGRKEIKVGSLDSIPSKELEDFVVYEAVEPSRIGGVLIPDHKDVGRYVQLISDADNLEYPYIIARINKVYTDDRLEVVAEYGIDYENKRHPLSHYTLFLHRSQLPKEDVTYFSK